MKIVLTYGTFDMFHVGHVRLLKRLKALGDYLIVGLSTDEFNQSKGKYSFFTYEERAEILQSCKYIDKVIQEQTWEQKTFDVDKYKVDIFAMGSDWKGEFDFLNKQCEVVYLDRTENISTTKIKNDLAKYDHDKLEILKSSLSDVIDIVDTLSRN